MGYDFKIVEKKWQDRWERERIFKGEVNPEREKFYITVAWPYPSGPMHVGHARTYGFPDIIARYKRMRGYNVLFPMGWHLTGTPIIGAVSRLKSREENFMKLARDVYGMTLEDIERINTPEGYAKYFTDESKLGYKLGMRSLGLSIDWSKEFTSITPNYSKEVEWQYRKFMKNGLVTTGNHPVKYCPRDDNPVTDHDLLEGSGVDIVRFFVIKYEGEVDGEKVFFPAATLRPETIFGVTNLWMKKNSGYVICKIKNELWLLSEDATFNLGHQFHIEKIREMDSSGMEGMHVKNPITDDSIPIFCAEFVDTSMGTGIVGSVPAHAPYDWMASQNRIQPKQVIETEGYSSFPARDVVERMGITSEEEHEKLDKATKKLYRDEERKGKMIVKVLNGKSVEEGRNWVEGALMKEERGDEIFEFSNRPVRCRCGSRCVIKIVDNQWFIRYSDESWKNRVKDYLNEIDLVPPETKNYFSNVIDWLNDWPFTRLVGLGTKVPWAPEWIIESLSDSTTYMSYYTIADIMNSFDSVDDELFEYIFAGEQNCWSGDERAKKAREAFCYWYPLDYRVSGTDLIPNHLTFMIFHHIAIFEKRFWPRGIVSLGLVILEGDMMHSSTGHIYPVAHSVEEMGADATRFYLFSTVEPWQDSNWKNIEANTTTKQLQHFYNISMAIMGGIAGNKSGPGSWLLSTTNKRVKEYIDSMEGFMTRKALQIAFYDMMNDYRWYIRRGGNDGETLKGFLEIWVKLLAPFIPHLCEEMWERLGHENFLSLERIAEPGVMDETVLRGERYLQDLYDDAKKILQAIPVKPRKMYVYCLPNERDFIDDVFLRKELDFEVEAQVLGKVTHDPGNRAKRAKAGKPAIYMEE